jgi:GNAT superfamily N-acetyltransferase
MGTRLATNRDGARLQELMKRAPQGSPDELSLSLVTAPDFFGRARMYEDAAVFVSDVEREPAGSAAVAVRELRLGGRIERVGYEFQYFTSPEHRRRGVAGELRERIEAFLADRGAALTTAMVSDENPPSYRFFQRDGFERVQDAPLSFVFVTQHTDVRPNMGIRLATEADLPRVVRLLRETWAGFDLTVDWDVAALERFVRRVIGPGLTGLLVREERGVLTACAGIWDWSAVQQFHIHTIAPALQPSLPTFRAGERLRQWGLTAVGYRDEAALAPLLRSIANRALAKGIEQIGVLDLPGVGDLGAIFGLPATRMGVGLYVKPLVPGAGLTGRPAYMDIIDF